VGKIALLCLKVNQACPACPSDSILIVVVGGGGRGGGGRGGRGRGGGGRGGGGVVRTVTFT
jgi:hypothetical protein